MVPTFSTGENIRISWLTNQPANYRIPIWLSLSNITNLKLYFVNKRLSNSSWNFESLSPLIYTKMNRRTYFGQIELALNPCGFRAIIRDCDALVVTGWQQPIYALSSIFAKKRGKIVLNLFESTLESHKFKGRLINKIRFLILNQADFVVTVGRSSTKAALSAGIDRKKIIQLFNPVDVIFFNEDVKTNGISRMSGHRYLFVGQLIARKNVLGALDAFAEVAEPFDTLTIVGDGPLRETVQRKVKELKLSDRVTITGHKSQEDVKNYYASCHTLIMPSIIEVWGLVANEALASGAHVVVSNVSGVVDLIGGMKGVYICETNSKSIAREMLNSRRDFISRIKNPGILQFTPERFAHELVQQVFVEKRGNLM